MHKRKFDLYALAALLIICGVALLRLIIIAQGWPQTNSDESTMGLMARHIAYQGAHPFVLYGQDYMGSIEAYLAALFFHILGPSVFSLRLGIVLLYALFLLSMYLLTTMLYNKPLALVTLVLLSLAPSEIIFKQVEALGGVPEIMVFSVLLLLLASWLVFTAPPSTFAPLTLRRRVAMRHTEEKILVGDNLSPRQGAPTPPAGRLSLPAPSTSPILRSLGFAAWGLIAGLALWSDPLVAPFILTPAILLLLFCYRELRTRAPLILLACFLIGISPYILYKVTTPPPQGSMQLFHATPNKNPQPVRYVSDSGVPVPPPTLDKQFEGMLLVTLPLASGANTLCPLTANEAWPLTSNSSLHTWTCTAVHGTWTLILIALWTAAVILSAREVRKYWPRRSQSPLFSEQPIMQQITPAPTKSATSQPATQRRAIHGRAVETTLAASLPPLAPQPTRLASVFAEERTILITHASRLTILAAAGLTLFLFTLFPNAAFVPWSSNRYLTSLMIATPAILLPLWNATYPLKQAKRWLAPLTIVLKYALILFVATLYLSGTILTFTLIPGAQAGNQQQTGLINNLLSHNITHIYSDYWTCDRISFESNERIICSVINDQFQPGFNRYQPYATQVQNDPHAAYALKANSSLAKTFPTYAAQTGLHYQQLIFNHYIIYQPQNP